MASSLFTALLFGIAQVDAGAQLTTSVSGGQSPASGGTVSEPTLIARTAPTFTLDRRTRISLLGWSYTPRLSLRYPSLDDSSRPFLLHQATIDYTTALERDLRFNAQLSGSAGEADFQTSQLVLGPNQSALPNTEHPTTTVGAITTTLTWIASRRWQLAWNARANHSDVRGGLQTRVTRDSADLGMTATRRLSLKTDLTANTRGGFQRLTTANYLRGELSAGVAHRFSSVASGNATAGIVLTSQLDGVETIRPPPASPFANLAFTLQQPRSRTVRWTHRYTLQMQPTADAVIEALVPRVTATASTSVTHVPERVTFTLAAFASSNATDGPLPGRPIETSAGASLTSDWQFAEDHALSSSLTTSLRGPHISLELPSDQPVVLVGMAWTWNMFSERLLPTDSSVDQTEATRDQLVLPDVAPRPQRPESQRRLNRRRAKLGRVVRTPERATPARRNARAAAPDAESVVPDATTDTPAGTGDLSVEP